MTGYGPNAQTIIDATLLALPIAAFALGAEARVCVWNEHATSMLGWTPEECYGSSLPGLGLEQREQIERLLLGDDTGRFSNLQTNWRHKDGRSLTVSISAARFPGMEPAERLAIGIVVDLTRTMALERQVLSAQKMEAIGRLAGGIAHDFDNLMVVVGGYSQLLIDLGAECSRERTQDCLREIARAAERASALTRQLLAFSCRQIRQPGALDLNSLISELATMLRRLIGEDIDLRLTLQEDAGIVLAHRGQMEQVILNLVVNARDAMPQGGRLEIATNTVTLETGDQAMFPTLPGPYLRLTVKDTGHGITPENRERIFEPFFTTKPASKGTGLGLTTVYGIIKQTGGEIAVESEEGRGATFSVYLPVTSLKPEMTIQKMASAQGGTETILVCDDERSVCKLIRETLSAKGYKILVSFDAASAMDIARELGGRLDLLLTDVIMSETSGVELAKRLVEVASGAKVLYMSAYSGSVLGQQAGIPQDIAFIEKPFTPDAIAQKVREILDGS